MREARREEIAYFRKMGVYVKVPIQECWDRTGKNPIATRWIDINKGDAQSPNYRSSASSWCLPEVRGVAIHPEVFVVRSCMCAFGMKQKDDQGWAYINKPTTFMANSPEAVRELERRCPGNHRHIPLVDGKAAAAQVYPKRLCTAVCRAIARQKLRDQQGLKGTPLLSLGEMGKVARQAGSTSNHKQKPAEALHDPEDQVGAWDDLSGEALELDRVREARREEIAYFRKMGVYVKVPIQECWDRTGKNPIATRWIDINKGDAHTPDLR